MRSRWRSHRRGWRHTGRKGSDNAWHGADWVRAMTSRVSRRSVCWLVAPARRALWRCRSSRAAAKISASREGAPISVQIY